MHTTATEEIKYGSWWRGVGEFGVSEIENGAGDGIKLDNIVF